MAAALQKVQAAGKAETAAVDKMNSTLPALTEMVKLAASNETDHNNEYDKAMAAYTEAITEQANAVNQYNLDNGRLTNIQNECKQPVKPPNCPKLISDAQKQLKTDEASGASPAATPRRAQLCRHIWSLTLLSCLPRRMLRTRKKP